MNRPRALLLAALLSVPLFAPRRAAADAFEPLGYGAAAKGMGGAYTALAEGGYAAYWNPAALAFLRKPQLTTSYEDLYGLGLLRYTGAGYSQPNVGGGGVSFHFLRLQTVGEASFYTYAENTYLLSYGRHFWGPFFAGAGLRFYSVAAEQRATGVGYDAALVFSPGSDDRFRLAAVAQDLNSPRIRYGTGATDVLPATYRWGGLLRLGPVSEFTAEQTLRRQEKQEYRVGTAHHLMGRKFVLRAGMHRAHRQDAWGVSVGGGLHFRKLDVDYAWDQHEDLGNSQTIGLTFRFGK